MHSILETDIEVFFDEVYRCAALALVLIEELMPAYGNMVVNPFQLRAGAPQLFTAGFQESGEVGVLGGVELVLGKGDKS